MTWKLRLVLWVLAADVSLLLCVGTGLIPAWGRWYGTSTAYRRQTDAFLEGRIELSSSPAAIDFDMAWAEGGVQQVWGLGVPAWRLPFEAAARLVGQPAFPDRIVLAIAIAMASYVVLRNLTMPKTVATLGAWIDFVAANPASAIAAAILLFFPQAISLCSGPCNVYEEPVIYGYYYSIALFAGMLGFSRQPKLRWYILLSLMAGLVGFVRPTMLAYGVATVATTWLVAIHAGWDIRKWIAGPVVFVAGGALLGMSNLHRFGAAGEFGHLLNLTGMDMLLFSRFHAPFSDEPLVPAGKELLGAMFAVLRLTDVDAAYESGLIAWQSPTPRWRHFYQTTFDASYVLLIAVCWGHGAAQVVKGYRRRLLSPIVQAGLPAIWSLIGLALLAAFYVNFHCISSRYIMDFVPGMAAAVAYCVILHGRWLASRQAGRNLSAAILLFWIIWWSYQLGMATQYYPRSSTWNQHEALEGADRSGIQAVTLPNSYDAGVDLYKMTGISYNGLGWLTDGCTQAVVVLFANDAEELKLKVSAAPGQSPSEGQYKSIQAKMGLQSLRLASVENTSGGRILTFAVPTRSFNQRGLQIVFLAFLPHYDVPEGRSPFRLERVEW